MSGAAILRRKAANPLMATVPSFLTWRALGFRSMCSGRLGFLSQSMPSETVDPSVVAPPSPGRKVLEVFTEEFVVGSRTITLETGKIARFANGSVVIGMEQTKVLSTVASAKGDGVKDFLPLTVMANVLSCDGQQDPDVMAANATSAALMLSDIPWNGPIGVIRLGRIDGQFVFNPTMDELSLSDLNLVYACTWDKTLMIDVQAREITEKDLEAALRLAHPEALKYIEPQILLAKKAGKNKKEYKLSLMTDKTLEKISSLTEAPIEAVFTDPTYGKFERGEALDKIAQDAKLVLEEQADEESLHFLQKGVDTVRKKALFGLRKTSSEVLQVTIQDQPNMRGPFRYIIIYYFSMLRSENCTSDFFFFLHCQVVRRRIIEQGLRVDGRHLDEVRPLHCEAGTYPILHGSSLFSRGDTQVLCTVTLGAPGDAQQLDSLVGPPTKRFMLHYNFPPFSINEIGKRGGLNRREVGHGTLAEKALLAVLPPEDDFPYTVRVNSEVMASDGSTSMASVCGGSMALMDAGIPLREHVAGLSVGLVSDVDPLTGDIRDYRMLTDILGLEDHLGDMDFKIAGTRKGITAIQLDIKPAGIPLDIICECLDHARNGRVQILDRMEEEISAPRTKDDTNAPRLATMKLSSYSLRRLLGPQGSQKKKIEEETGARFAFSEGTLTIVAKNQDIMEKARDKIDSLVGREIEVGGIYKGIVGSIKEYGAFVELRGGQLGLLHISELSHEQASVSRVSDVVSVGQELSLMCIGQDVRGNIKLSLKATLLQPGSEAKNTPLQVSMSSAKQEINVWASVGNVSDGTTAESSEKEDEDEGDEATTCAVPSIVIRSAVECDAQDLSPNQSISKRTENITRSPRPYSPSKSWNLKGSPKSSEVYSKIRNIVNSTLTPPTKKQKQQEASKCDVPLQMIATDKPKSLGKNGVKLTSLKLGDTVKAKVYQVRAHGLVLDLGGGIKGMYKFEANGRRDFELGDDLDVKCSSFSSKGIPVMSILDNN
ncbi:hypothetical protein Taro_040567 [Colocasia esculenta]|uniref:polyribonucleotide nucleotidyltransferase n=1 Tax=Colocasia esculenta TaxID=4460 RepID=A0A843WJD9_COLES|nr:hypothetical protein [Colocasia esculenta]